jgi:heterotetrameric sarcosine oxidase gamma subunit
MANEAMLPTMTRIPGSAVAAIRVFQGGEAAVAAAAQRALGVSWPAAHGPWTGDDPCLIWRSPAERLALASSRERLAGLLDALRPGADEAGCVVDLSEMVALWRLEGAALPEVLARLADAAALPPPGHATRLRWADIAVVLLRVSDSEALLLADATFEPYLRDWWAYACGAL